MAATRKKPIFSVSGIDISSDRGKCASDFITNTATQTITGSLSKKLALAADTGASAADGITRDGTIHVAGLETGDGEKSAIVRQTGAAGNVSAASTALAFTLDIAAPAALLTGEVSSQVKLDQDGETYGDDGSHQIAVVGPNGEYVVTWWVRDTNGDYSIFVQKFNTDGTTAGSQVKLGANGVTSGWNVNPQVAAVGTNGEYVVTWSGQDTSGDSLFMQKFDADGTTQGSQVKLEGSSVAYGHDYSQQITALGTDGEYVVTWLGPYTDGDQSIFVQKFNADGATLGQAGVYRRNQRLG